ncbi:extracellular solute-binding protein [Enterococcus sp. BWB1-3]|uniref:extracellular solute-binding protein n=1 Tax=unclassified Enterococcus TaxID=2608891 RepID=UPI001921BDA4|nr:MULTISPECIES: extracellular solute-binding protein [unclassified Enterococcus]MBL1229768.1 extracellular solute-binding protein [Enterococcus sp. BWB1-3]MCB5956266.1 extracellular solute-binding protein [Enterococcus sp. CWB-B31]
MKKWRKLFMVGILAVASISLVACGNNSSDNGKDETDFNGKTLKLGVWGGNESEEKSLKSLITDFEEETGAKVSLKTYTDYNTQIQTDLIGKTAPDAFYVDSSYFPFLVSKKALAPLDKEGFSADKYYENLINSFSDDGNLYAIPKDFSTLALYKNTGIFEEVGVDPDSVPGSYEELIDWLPGFQKKLDEKYGEGKVKAMSYTAELSRAYHLAARDGAEPIMEDGMPNLEDENVVNNLSILKELIGTDAVVTPQEIGAGWNGEAFGTGKIAMMDEGNWVYQTLKDEFKDINFSVSPMATYKGEEGGMMFSVGWGKYAGTNSSALADAWIKFATGKEGMAKWVNGTGTLPTRDDVAETADVSKNEDLKIHLTAVDYSTVWQKGTSLTTINNAYMNYWPDVASGKTTLEDAMKKADKQAIEDIKKAE